MNARKKLLLTVGALGCVIAAMGGSALFSASRLGAELDDSANVTSRKLVLFGEAKSDILSLRLAVRNCTYYSKAEMSADFSASGREFEAVVERSRMHLSEMRPLMVSEKGKAALASMADGVTEYAGAGHEFIEFLTKGRTDDALRLENGKLKPSADRILSQIDEYLGVQNTYVANAASKAAASVSRSTAAAIVLLLIGLAVTGIAVLIIRQLNATLSSMARDMRTGAQELTSASSQVSSASQSLAQGSTEQAAAIEQVSSSLEEITAMTRQNAESAVESAKLMGDAQKTGGSVREAVNGLESAVQQIHESNGEIARILRSIDEIAFQTNILALNAAVEAARAGDAGAGFAVVADEVRNLAQRCATAAKETAEFVDRNGTSAGSAIQRVTEVRSTWAQSGSIRDRVNSLSDSIATSSTEQDRGVQQISRAVSQMNGVTQQTAAQAEESASASEELTAQAEVFRSLADRLLTIVGS